MRIGVDCRSLQEPFPSGVSVYTREVLHAMLSLPEAAEHEFVFFLNEYAFQADPEALEKIRKGLVADNVSWSVRTWPNKLLTALEICCNRPRMHWMFEAVNVVFVPNMHFFPVTDSSAPMVMTVHDLSFDRYPECLDRKGLWRHKLLQPRRFVNRADHIIAVSNHTKSDLESLYQVPAGNITTVYPGAAGVKTAETRGVKMDLPGRYILTLSTLEPRKNIETLLQAFDLIKRDHPEVHLLLVGAKGWKAKPLVKRIALDPRARHYGYVSDQTKEKLLSEASLFVYPSLYEGFGFPPLEAQTHGVPVVVGAHSSLPEVLGESALYADILDARSLARAMDHMLKDETLREGFIQQGRQNVERFSWTVTAERTFDILKKTAAV